jgi:hypothetical protein
MTKDGLKQFIRFLLDDKRGEYLVNDLDLGILIDEAEKEAAERALYLPLSKSDAVPVIAGQPTYQISCKTIFLTMVKLSLGKSPLIRTTRQRMDFNVTSWESKAETPLYYMMDGLNLTLYPIPIANDTLLLEGFRRPCREMETPEQYHESLAYWCLYRIYSVPDIDVMKPGAAELNLQKFTKAFGHKREAMFDTVWQNTEPRDPFYQSPFFVSNSNGRWF